MPCEEKRCRRISPSLISWPIRPCGMLYHAYYSKIITREVAAAEKGRIKCQYDRAVRQMEFDRKLCTHHVRVIKATEGAKCSFRKNPSIEAGMRLCQVMDGIQLPALDEL